MLGVLGPQQLDRHRPFQHRVQPPPHLPDGAGRDRLIEPVTAREHDTGEGHDGPDPTRPAVPVRYGNVMAGLPGQPAIAAGAGHRTRMRPASEPVLSFSVTT